MCDTCGMSFSRKSNIFRHIIVHTGKQPYICKTGGILFTRKGDLIKHNPFHTGDKPYKCRFARKSFALKYQINKTKLCTLVTNHKAFFKLVDND